MERSRVEEERIRYRKIGGGSLHLKNRIIKPNEVFRAYPSEIPKAFRDTVIPLDKEPEPVKPEEAPLPVPPVKAEYKITPRGKSKTWFDIVDAKGKTINEKALTRVQAEQFVQDLER